MVFYVIHVLLFQVRLAGLGVAKCKDTMLYHNPLKGNKLRAMRFKKPMLKHYKDLYRKDWGVEGVYFCQRKAYTNDSILHPECDAKWGKD